MILGGWWENLFKKWQSQRGIQTRDQENSYASVEKFGEVDIKDYSIGMKYNRDWKDFRRGTKRVFLFQLFGLWIQTSTIFMMQKLA